MLHDLGAPVVEDEQVVVGLDEIDGLTGEEPGDVESGAAHLNDAVDGDSAAAHVVPADGPQPVPRPGWIRFRCRVPCLTRCDPAGQPLECREARLIGR